MLVELKTVLTTTIVDNNIISEIVWLYWCFAEHLKKKKNNLNICRITK